MTKDEMQAKKVKISADALEDLPPTDASRRVVAHVRSSDDPFLRKLQGKSDSEIMRELRRLYWNAK